MITIRNKRGAIIGHHCHRCDKKTLCSILHRYLNILEILSFETTNNPVGKETTTYLVIGHKNLR